MNRLLTGKTSERLAFRLLQQQDFPVWLEFFKDPQTNIYWQGDTGTPEERCLAWFDKTFDRYRSGAGGMNVLVEKSSGLLVGQCGLLIQNVEAKEELEIGYSILPVFWKKGYATEAAVVCKEHATVNKLADSLISIIHIDNKESQAVALRMGMEVEKRTVYKNNPVEIFRVSIRG